MRGIRQNEVENRFARVTSTGAFRFAHITRGIASVGPRSWNQLRRQAVCLLNHANGIVGAIQILTIDGSIVVVVDAVVTNLGFGHTIRRKEARRVRTIDLVVAVVVLAVIANFSGTILAGRRHKARRVRAINEFVAILVQSASAHFGFARRHAYAGNLAIAVGIGTIDEQIAIIVRMIVARFYGILAFACLGRRAIEIRAIDGSVAVIVEAIVATRRLVRQTAACRSSLAIRIEAIDDLVAIVIDAVVTNFSRRRRHASTFRSRFARGISTILDTIAIVVRAIHTVFSIAWKNLRIHVIAITASALERGKTIIVIVPRTVDTKTIDTCIGGARIVINALLRNHAFATATLTTLATTSLPRLPALPSIASYTATGPSPRRVVNTEVERGSAARGHSQPQRSDAREHRTELLQITRRTTK